VRAHLEACWQCRARASQLDRTVAEFAAAYRHQAETDLPSSERSMALLRARLGRIESVAPSRSIPGASVAAPRLKQILAHTHWSGYAAAAVCAVCIVGFIGLISFFSLGRVHAEPVPDSTLTPGATRTAEREEICPVRPVDGFYPIPATLAYRVFEKYGIRDPQPRTYEVDYLITPALGGADDIRNLWPQPYATGEWNAHIKDALEDHLHEQVCAEKLDLETAQRDIAANWIAAYQKYFNTERPLRIHTTFSIDPPWED
jgi:hypothetical protein